MDHDHDGDLFIIATSNQPFKAGVVFAVHVLESFLKDDEDHPVRIEVNHHDPSDEAGYGQASYRVGVGESDRDNLTFNYSADFVPRDFFTPRGVAGVVWQEYGLFYVRAFLNTYDRKLCTEGNLAFMFHEIDRSIVTGLDCHDLGKLGEEYTFAKIIESYNPTGKYSSLPIEIAFYDAKRTASRIMWQALRNILAKAP